MGALPAPTLVFFILAFIFKGVILIVLLLQFIVGAAQLMVTLCNTAIQLVESGKLPKALRQYWLLVTAYLLLMAILFYSFRAAGISRHFMREFFLYYILLAWDLALFHFDNVMSGQKKKEISKEEITGK